MSSKKTTEQTKIDCLPTSPLVQPAVAKIEAEIEAEIEAVKEIDRMLEEDLRGLDGMAEVTVETGEERAEKKNAELRADPSFVRELRRMDSGSNHTCGHCLRRLPVGDFYRGKKDNICIACGGK